MRSLVTAADLEHIPGEAGLPYLGCAVEFLRDTYGLCRRHQAQYGPIVRVKFLGEQVVALYGLDAMEMLLEDRDQILSSAAGWWLLRGIGDGGLSLRDFDEHRAHRNVIQEAFRSSAMAGYLTGLNMQVAGAVKEWPETLDIHDASKRLILRLGASTFLGLPLASKEAERFDAAFEALVQAPFSLVRLPVPGLPWARAMAARKYLRATLRTLIPARRAAGGEDFFSRMVAAMDGLMTSWTEDDLINHFIFLILAAHNPTTSMLAAMAEALADHPEWQERVREEMLALGGPSLSSEALGQVPQTQWVLKEVLRLTAPLGFILRRTTAPLEWMGYTIPAGANVGVAPAVAMRSAEVYSNPERFDPERFAPHRAEDAVHPYAWAPFGGGAHRCIGMHFAQMQAKVFFFHLLTRYRLEPLRDAPAVRWKQVPLATPIGGVPLRLVPLAAS